MGTCSCLRVSHLMDSVLGKEQVFESVTAAVDFHDDNIPNACQKVHSPFSHCPSMKKLLVLVTGMMP